MSVEIKLAAVVFLFYTASLVLAQERCGYMEEIPRPPRPDNWTELDFEGVTWSERPLIPAPDRLDVCMDAYFAQGSTYGTQIIYMEEEIEGEVAIAKLNYHGTLQPYVSVFITGQRNLLGPDIRYIDGEWLLIITQRQDYETPSQRLYMFNVQVDDESLVAGVTLQIVNIDDNAPIIHLFDTCLVPELGDPRLTECVYEVSDADGEISTRFIWFEIDSIRGDQEVFYMHRSEFNSSDPNIIYMTVGLYSALNFETSALHIFSVTAYDSLPNHHTITLMVRVENVEHRPPRWVEIFAVQQFDEKSEQNFTVKAIDGDTDINKPINYTLITAEEDDFFSIETLPGGEDGGIFYVSPIDRDTLERELFQLSIIAFKEDNSSLYTSAPVVIIVNDINDQRPEPLNKEYFLEMEEETAMTLNFGELEFGFHDRDLGQHAQYSVRLESEYPPGAENAFYISPEVGYQRQTFIMGTTNHSMLDYEVPVFQNIKLKVIATDMNNTAFTGEATVYITLQNWNDEVPIFELDSQVVTFEETVGADFIVGTTIAHDRDIDDRVIHSLMGNAGDYLTIDEDTGVISVSIDEAFDYHRQSQLIVQIQAIDTLGEPYHTVTSQLTIELIDINNTPPTLRLPRVTPQVEENVPEGYLITDEITATDPDTTAYLVFDIDWDASYATKQGRMTDAIEYVDCVDIETEYPTGNTGSAIGRVLVKEIRDNITIDYEEFEVLYLAVRVQDLNTSLGVDYDELTFTVVIIDMNDNRPLWVEGSLETELRVREVSASGTVVGTVQASDIDGPMYNQVRYTIHARNNTPEGLVKIDAVSGQITVDEDGAIDADDPRRYHLYYTVVATDRCNTEPEDCPPDPTYWDTPGDIAIEIVDTNNKDPQPERELFNTTVRIYENVTTGDGIVTIIASDLDRDEIYHTVRYQINYLVNPSSRNFFEVDQNTGWVHVEYTTAAVLDRDRGEPEHSIFFLLIDNFYREGDGNSNQYIDLEVIVILMDVNDNAPELPSPDTLSWNISENLEKGYEILPYIFAPDIDEPGTENSRVGYEIVEVTASNRDIEVPELFDMMHLENPTGNVSGQLVTAMDLKGYWGTYNVHIWAYDHGDPQQEDFAVYQMVIRPYNYHVPEFVFPTSGTVVRLAKERALVANILYLVNGEPLDLISAIDEDGLDAGIVTFTIVGDDEGQEFFEVSFSGENQGALVLTQLFPEEIREFQVTIRATDGGTEPGALYADSTMTAVFVPTTSDPVFTTTAYNVAFVENEVGMTEQHQLPHATDPKNHRCEDDCYNIYYRIIEGNEEGFFGLNQESNVVFLVRELNRSEAETRVLVLGASNSPAADAAVSTSTLTLTVTVREADPRPNFVRDIYTAGISTTDTIGRELITVQATHTEDVTITYSLDHDTMQADSTLEAVKHTAFILNSQSGVLTLNIQPTASMQGMFEFEVVATDIADSTDRALVRVYLITSQNRVYFIFYNELEQIEENIDFIQQTFTTAFGMTCNIDQVVPASDSDGIAVDDRTEVHAHFIRDNEPVDAATIELLRSDTQLLRSIQNTLDTRLIVLEDFVTGLSPAVSGNTNQVTVYVLATLSSLLAFMCLVLLITFIVRTRALNRRLEALYMTKYGSDDSGLNRVGLAAPGTNKHAVEGSNPIWNESIKAPDFDAVSDASGDSDLIGIEDMPQFQDDYFPPGDSNSLRGIMGDEVHGRDSLPNHSNNFNFNTSPFSHPFNDMNLKR